MQPLPPQEKTLDELVAEFLSSEAPPPPEALDETLALGSPDGWVAMLGQLARRRAWKRLVEISASMLVAHRGGGAPGLTAEQVKHCVCMYNRPWFAEVSSDEAVGIGERGTETDVRPGGLDPWCRGGVGII